jgi:hypothetical protein
VSKVCNYSVKTASAMGFSAARTVNWCQQGNALIKRALGWYSEEVCWQLGGCNSDESAASNELMRWSAA